MIGIFFVYPHELGNIHIVTNYMIGLLWFMGKKFELYQQTTHGNMDECGKYSSIT